MNFTLTDIEKSEIRDLHRNCTKRRFADKLKSLLLLDRDFSCVEVGEMLLLDDDTIRKYRNQYLSSGTKDFLTDNNKGTLSCLSSIQLEELEQQLVNNTYIDSKGIVVWIKDKFNVKYSPSGITNLLKRIGFVYKKPVLTPCKENVEKQELFVKEYQEIKDNLGSDDQIYFVDGVHPQHNTIATSAWIKKGKTKHLKTKN